MLTAEAMARVQRHGDGRQDSDDRHDDQQLDQREAPLTSHPLSHQSKHGRFLPS
jgi:hypothetical protein